MLTIIVILMVMVCLIIIGLILGIGALLGSGIIVIIAPILLDVICTVLVLKLIFRRKKKTKNKRVKQKG